MLGGVGPHLTGASIASKVNRLEGRCVPRLVVALFPNDEERPVTSRPYEMADDDLSRQRRKREERLLAQAVPGDPAVTVGDLVADVLAAGGGDEPGRDRAFDAGGYLAERGHDWSTIKTVVDYLERQDARPNLPLPSDR
jgi:hypothetical protein